EHVELRQMPEASCLAGQRPPPCPWQPLHRGACLVLVESPMPEHGRAYSRSTKERSMRRAAMRVSWPAGRGLGPGAFERAGSLASRAFVLRPPPLGPCLTG